MPEEPSGGGSSGTTGGIVDVGGKPDVPRRAVAAGRIALSEEAIQAIRAGQVAKGDALGDARVAALMAIKATPSTLPHCHPIPLTSADVTWDLGSDGLEVRVAVEAVYKTGVEMEALHGVAVALLTVWDMVKPLEKDADGRYPTTRIEDVRVVEKKVLRAGAD